MNTLFFSALVCFAVSDTYAAPTAVEILPGPSPLLPANTVIAPPLIDGVKHLDPNYDYLHKYAYPKHAAIVKGHQPPLFVAEPHDKLLVHKIEGHLPKIVEPLPLAPIDQANFGHVYSWVP